MPGANGLALLAFALLTPPATAPLAAQGTRVVLLGTGTPNAEPERSGPAVAVVVGGSVYLVDAGPGVVRRAAAAEGRGLAALAQPNLRIVFLTHLHSDHTLGLADLMFTPWVLDRVAPLEVYGPRGTRAMVEHLEAAYSEDVRIRLDGLQPANRTGWQANPHEIRPGLVFSDSNVRVTAFLVAHGSWPEAYGYRFDTADRSIVISGDTRPSEAVVEACNGCDVLVHEVYSQQGFEGRPPEWQRYHARFHTSAPELGVIASRARPGLLVLYHQLLGGGAGGLARGRAAPRRLQRSRRLGERPRRLLICQKLDAMLIAGAGPFSGRGVDTTFGRAKRELARFQADSALIDLMLQQPERGWRAAYSMTWYRRAIVGSARLAGWLLHNRRFGGCGEALVSAMGP